MPPPLHPPRRTSPAPASRERPGGDFRPGRCRAGSIPRVSMAKKLYVGNLSYDVTDSALEQMFQEFGEVRSAQVIMDRDTGRSKGFGFVEMSNDHEAQAAVQALNGKQVGGRQLTVNEARPKTEGGGRGGSGGSRRY